MAYDGHRAKKGRVATDSTWHHFVNINLDGTGEPGFTGLQSPAGVDTEALIRIRQYYVNLATWLMPRNVRRCLTFPLVAIELARYPLFEELELRPLKDTDGAQLRLIGEQVTQSVARRTTRWEAQGKDMAAAQGRRSAPPASTRIRFSCCHALIGLGTKPFISRLIYI